MIKYLHPKLFFSAVLLSFCACSLAGYIVSKNFRYNRFVRFFAPLTNAIDYYPTAHELLVTAQHNVKTNKILVVIGGSSIMRGDGQNIDDLWSNKLQHLLGNKFKVLNYAFNGAQFAAFGAVGFRILKEMYPKSIFVSTCSFAGEENEIDGGALYRSLFWDAYYKGLIHPNDNEKILIKNVREKQLKTMVGKELHIMSSLDSLFYFRNLWNWIGYRFVFTVWNKNAMPEPFQARRFFNDVKIDNKSLAESVKNNKDRFESEMRSLRIMDYPSLLDTNKEHFIKNKYVELFETYNDIFDQNYRNRILCVVTPYNSRHISRINGIEQKSYNSILVNFHLLLGTLGYNSMTPNQLVPEDYMDVMHFVNTGGYKIAEQVAPRVVKIAKEQNYL